MAVTRINAALEPARELERAYERIVDRSLDQRDILDAREIRNLRRTTRRCTHGEGERASAAEDGRQALPNVEFDSEPSAGPSGTVTTDFGTLGFTRVLGVLRHVCETIPIYAPGEVKENSNTTASLLNYTTHHIRQALGWAPQDTIGGQIAARSNTTDWRKWSGGIPDPINLGAIEIQGRPNWTILTRNTNGAPATGGGRSGRTWYNRATQWCGQNRDPLRVLPPRGTVCDEFPFYSTSQGGPVPGLTASLKFVPGTEQPELNQGNESSAQGVDLGRFYSETSGCDVQNSDPFFVIPMPDVRPIQNIFTQAGIPFAQQIGQGEPLPRPVADLLRSRFICEQTP